MRKIENEHDWLRLVDDIKSSGVHEGYLGLSQNNDAIDCNLMFKTLWNPLEACVCGVELKGARGERWLNANGFFDMLLINYRAPFYIVDTGANYRWL